MRRDDPDVYEVKSGPPELTAPVEAVIAALSPLVTETRLARMRTVVAGRTLDVVPVLDRVHDPHNASAILRTADALGVQRVDVVPAPTGFLAARGVSKGTHRWLDIARHASPSACAASLHARGYEVFVAAMDGEHTPADLAARPRVAVVFGNEHAGVSPEMRAHADGSFAIPMRGFVESLNVSVAAAITLYALTAVGRASLSSDAQRELLARYLMASVRDAGRVVEEYVAADPGFK